jgi:hypothetical protein
MKEEDAKRREWGRSQRKVVSNRRIDEKANGRTGLQGRGEKASES